jgi:predicted XRE-type DNA-binding protein
MTNSTSNSFSALGFKDDDAVIEALRADLADIVRGYIERSQLTQTALQRTLQIPQSTISAIKNDRIDHLSIEYFVRILTRARIPWTAKSWKPPHDAMWVTGGITQLLARATNDKTASPVNVTAQQYWNPPIRNYSLVGTSGDVGRPLDTTQEGQG